MITVDPRDCAAISTLKKIAGGTANRAPVVELHTAGGMLVAESSDSTASGSVRIPCAGELDKVKVRVEPLADVLSNGIRASLNHLRTLNSDFDKHDQTAQAIDDEIGTTLEHIGDDW